MSGKNVSAKHQQSNALVELLDIFPTLCDMAGLKIPAKIAGKSFYPLTKKPNLPWKPAAFSQFLLGHFPKKESGKNDRMGYTIRTNKFRYVAWYAWKNNTKGNLIAQELYDETIDPSENNNLAGIQSYKKTMANVQHQLEKQWVNQQ